MHLYRLVARHRCHQRLQTTDSGHGLPIAPNRLNRDFSALRPNQKWVADITSIATNERWLYLARVQGVFSRKIIVSMSRVADPYNNALMESFIGTLKTECADHVFVSPQAARSQLFAYLEGWYNRRRLHSALGYVSLEQFEHRFLSDNDSLHSHG
jgi:putative transposase